MTSPVLADYVVLTIPLTPESRGMLGREALAAMRPTARLVNLARGAVLDQQALVEALASGRLAWAAGEALPGEPRSLVSGRTAPQRRRQAPRIRPELTRREARSAATSALSRGEGDKSSRSVTRAIPWCLGLLLANRVSATLAGKRGAA